MLCFLIDPLKEKSWSVNLNSWHHADIEHALNIWATNQNLKCPTDILLITNADNGTLLSVARYTVSPTKQYTIKRTPL
jgi:hypothetical protein